MTNQLLSILLAAPQGGQDSTSMIIPMVLIMVVFYFFMIRPQMKKQKEIRQFRESIKNGDKVVTLGGIYGKVVETTDTTIMLDIANNVKIKVAKDGIVKDPADILDASKK